MFSDLENMQATYYHRLFCEQFGNDPEYGIFEVMQDLKREVYGLETSYNFQRLGNAEEMKMARKCRRNVNRNERGKDHFPLSNLSERGSNNAD